MKTPPPNALKEVDRTRAQRARSPALSEADCRLLAFAAEHRLVLEPHAAVLLGSPNRAAGRRLSRLTCAGYLRRDDQLRSHRSYQIDRRGLNAIASTLPRPRVADLGGYEHDVGMAWVWLAARRGAFGPTRAVLSERRMRSQDGRPRPEAVGPERFGVRLPGVGPSGGDRRHYPDLLIETAAGQRVAIELELTLKGRRRREEILSGYAFDGRVDAVIYLIDRPQTGHAIARSAGRVGIGHMVSVQRVAFAPGAGGISPGRTGDRTHRRTQERSARTSRGPNATPDVGR